MTTTYTILPPPRTYFFDTNANPLSGGLVYTYLPNTTTPVVTYQDSAGMTPNTNPVVLDGNGSAQIYGLGSYTFELHDSAGNLVFNGLTNSTGTSGTSTPPGGTSGQIQYNNSGAFGGVTYVPLTNGGTGVGTFTAYGVVCGGTTATNPLQSVASVGTAGQVLTSNGAGAMPTFQAGSAGSNALILLKTITASTAESVVFDNTVITNSYNKYIVEFDGVYGSASSTDVLLTVSTNNGSGYLSANYFSAGQHQGADTATITGADTGTSSSINLSFAGGNGITSNSTSTAHGTIKFSNPLASAVCQFIFDFVGFNTSTFVHYLGWGFNTGTTAINNIKIAPSTGTITGNFHLYGIVGT